MLRPRQALRHLAFVVLAHVAASAPAHAGCREDAIEAAKACMSEDLEAGMQDESADAKRIAGELYATGQDIKNLNRQGDLYKKLAAQSKRGSLLAAMKARACSKAHKACSSSCENEQDDPQSQEAYSACKSIGKERVKLAEDQAGHLLENMQTNEKGLASTATMIEHPEGKTGNSACNDSYSSPECSRQAQMAASSGPGARTHSPEQYAMASAIDPNTGEEVGGGGFQFDGRFETAANASVPSVFAGYENGGDSSANTGAGPSAHSETTGAALASGGPRAAITRAIAQADAETADASDSEVGEGKKKTLKKRVLRVIQGFMNFVSGGRIALSPLDETDSSPSARIARQNRKAKSKAISVAAGEPPAALKKDGVTSATGMSLFEKIHRQYQIQEASLSPD